MSTTSNSIPSKFVTLAGAIAVGAFVFAAPAYAAGGGGGTTAATPSCKGSKAWDKSKKKCVEKADIVPTCFFKKVWDAKQRKCVKAVKESRLDDDNLFAAARDLAYNRRYAEALNVLELVEDKDAPRVLNFKGYSTRKLGRVEEGLTYYAAALKADPDYTLVREYMGEAFLQLGQVDKAREQLVEIGKRCGTDCREYSMLETEITKYLTR